MKYNVAEKFISINGEGSRAGQAAVFIRFTGCNLRCSYCDTMWANKADAPYTEMTSEEIHRYITESGIRNVTLTGGEPLIQDGIYRLIRDLCGDDNLSVEIETNGSCDISPYDNLYGRPIFTLDYKLPSCGMEDSMLTSNYEHLQSYDCVKFVVGSDEDLQRAAEIIRRYRLCEKCRVYFSPVFGKIQPVHIVEFILENRLNGVNMQLQLHKLIWSPDKKGV